MKKNVYRHFVLLPGLHRFFSSVSYHVCFNTLNVYFTRYDMIRLVTNIDIVLQGFFLCSPGMIDTVVCTLMLRA